MVGLVNRTVGFDVRGNAGFSSETSLGVGLVRVCRRFRAFVISNHLASLKGGYTGLPPCR